MNRREQAEPNESLLAARRGLESLPNVRVVGELLWDEKDQVWAFAVELTINSADTVLVPATTRWFFVVDKRYPWGSIDIYPAKENGLDKTFPHQDYNGDGDEKHPWRDGDICVRAPGFALGRSGEDPDPKGAPDRIAWYAARAIEWLERASCGELLKVGDDFELPQCKAEIATVGFSEDSTSFEVWQKRTATFGTVELVPVGNGFPLAARRFRSSDAKEIYSPTWGRTIQDNVAPLLGAWIRLPAIPVLPPYAAPMRWGELFKIMEQVGVSPADVLQQALRPLRDGKPHVLMIGFPIPRLVGQAPSVMHWQPLQLPSLTHGTKPRKGFSASDKGYWLGDVISSFGSKKPIEWLSGKNWHDTELGIRGRLSPELRAKSVLLLGAGAIGSAVAELLVRGGLHQIVVIDDDSMAAGNLVRHTLTLQDVGRGKAARLALRLNTLSPHADAVGIAGHFPRLSTTDHQTVSECNLILDCSGADDTLQALSESTRPAPVHFASVAMGRGAKRLYVFTSHGTSFPVPTFRAVISPWLTKDATEFKDLEFPWEGVGCWHPVFPASSDLVALFAAATVRELSQRLALSDSPPVLVTLEHAPDSDDGVVLRRDITNA